MSPEIDTNRPSVRLVTPLRQQTRGNEMSDALLKLQVDHPPFALERSDIDGELRWASRCYGCGGKSRSYSLMSTAMRVQQAHGDEHLEYDRAALADLLNTEVVASPRQRSDAGIRRRPQPLDRVHIREPAVA